MSFQSTPIDSHCFAAAIKDLPLPNLHLKAAELCNSVAHLHSSNRELKPFADGGDPDCVEAIGENLLVVERMEGRILLLRFEIKRRGFEGADEERGSANEEVKGPDEFEGRNLRASYPQTN